MLLPRGSNALLAILVLLLVCGLALLATLQYRWIDRVSDAERQRMRGNLDFAARHVGDEIRGELEEMLRAFSDNDVAVAYDDWTRRAAHPELLAAIYVYDRQTLELFDPAAGRLHVAEWPDVLAPVRDRFERGPQRGPGMPFPMPFVPEVPALIAVRHEPPPEPGSFEERPRPQRAAILQISRAALQNILPAIVEKHFPHDYDVALVSGDEILYRTNASWPDGRAPADAELALPMFGGGAGPPGERRDPPRFRRFDRGPREEQGAWRLLVRRHDGGVDAIIASARRRNLAISFGTCSFSPPASCHCSRFCAAPIACRSSRPSSWLR